MLSPAETRQLADALCRERFAPFALAAFNVYDPGTALEWNWHIECVSEHLEAVHRGELPRLIINIPPRSLKSFLCSCAFPAWVIGKDPSEKFMVASHTLRPLAAKLSNDTRRILESQWYANLFPKVNIVKSTETEISTSANGQRLAFAVGQSPVGMGFNYGIADDINRPDEALSDLVRTKTNEWFDQNFMSRFNDYRTAKIIIVMQRVHTDDLTGHLLDKGGYHLLKLPAETKRRTIVTLGHSKWTQPDEHLMFPARLTEAVLAEKKNDMGDYAFAGQFGQEPVPIGGGMFKDTWPRRYGSRDFSAKGLNVYILVDPATSKKKTSDWTAMQVVGLGKDNNYYLLDMVRDKFNPTERVNKIMELHRKWNHECGRPPKVGWEEYGLAADIHYIEERQKQENYRFPLEKLGGKQAKTERISRLIPDMQNGRWWFPEAITYTDTRGLTFDLVQEMIRGEMLTFPVSKHDDCLDALARIYDVDLGAVFPKVETTGKRRVQPPQSWMDM